MLPKIFLSNLLDSAGVAICGFDDEHRTTFWNHTFLDFFPEHDGWVREGEHYADNLRRFYQVRLRPEELPDLERLVAEGIARHSTQQQPFDFTHHGRRLQVASLPVPGGGRVRIWRPENRVELPRSPSPIPIPAFDIFDHIPDGASIIDREQRLLVCNDAFRRLYDLPAALPVVGLTLDDIVRICWRRRSPVGELTASLRNRLRYDGAPFEVELPDGRWLRVISRSEADESVFCIHADITELKRQQADLMQAQAALSAAYSELALAATQDPLTGLANRRSFNERLDALIPSGVGLILIDADNFKSVNDCFGHVAGDDVLRLIGLAIAGATRGSGALAARIGGEEFAVLDDANLSRCMELADAIRQRLAQMDWSSIHPSLSRITVSMGVGVFGPSEMARDIKEAVDEALYRAKRQGKDRIELAARPGHAMTA